MTDPNLPALLERAAREIDPWAFASLERYTDPNDPAHKGWQEQCEKARARTRRALLAFLDPEDEETLAWISCELSLDDQGEDIAYQVIASLRALAQEQKHD